MPAPRSEPDRLTALHNSLSYHRPDDKQTAAIEELRDAQKVYGAALLRLTPAGREQSVAITQFEDSCMWAVKAIVLESPKA